MQSKINAFLLCAFIPFSLSATEMETETESDSIKKFDLPTIVVVQSTKNLLTYDKLYSPITQVSMRDILQQGLKNPKKLSSIVPNLYIPDYGSSMTSTIYMRGFGSRIDNPVLGLYVDDVPIIDKNNYDFDFFDVKDINVFRGPQSTLYGRNSMLGVMEITTLSPSDTNGGTINLEYGKNNWVSTRASYYKKHFGFSIGYRHSDGYFRNEYNGDKVDNYDALSFRGKYQADLMHNLSFENSLSLSLLKQGGYAYGQYKDGVLHNVNYNDTCTYKRFSLVDGLKLKLRTGRFSISSVTSVQWLIDRMFLDNDFTSADIFTLAQEQHQYALTEEIILRPEKHPSWWNHQTGVFAMFKHNNLTAPVELRQTAINSFILDEANSAMAAAGSPMRLAFSENVIPIRDDFQLENFDVALFHESYFTLKNWLITAGLRLDYERNSMNYNCDATVHWLMNMVRNDIVIPYTNPREVNSVYNGHIHHGYIQLLPKLAMAYNIFPSDRSINKLKLTASVSKGFKAGGYNTQIFSDIIKNKLKTDMMIDAHRPTDSETAEITSENTTYKPETCINYEIGSSYSHAFDDGGMFRLSVTGFLVNSNNLQITVMSSENSTGRVMANAGKARSVGFEADGSYIYQGWNFSASFGYTNAYFRQYVDGNNDYCDKKIPYAPQSTLMMRTSKQFQMGNNIFTIGIEGNQIGKMWWNELNTIHQNNYFTLNADASFSINKFTVYGRIENITCTDYYTFYFKSVGNEFMQKGKPFQWTVGCTYSL